VPAKRLPVAESAFGPVRGSARYCPCLLDDSTCLSVFASMWADEVCADAVWLVRLRMLETLFVE
jgi:hypothetical protein